MTTSYQKIKSKAMLYKLAANQNDAPIYRVTSSVVLHNNSNVPMKAALEAIKSMLTVIKGGAK